MIQRQDNHVQDGAKQPRKTVRFAKLAIAVASLAMFSGGPALVLAQNTGGNGGQQGQAGGQGAGQGGGQGQGGGRRGGRNFDPAQMQQRLEGALKDALGATDDEWSALQPRVDQIMKLQAQLRSRGLFSLMRRGGPNGGGGGQGGQGNAANAQGGGGAGGAGGAGGGGGGQGAQGEQGGRRNRFGGGGGGMFGGEQTGPLADALKALQDTLDNQNASADDIKTKLQAVRDARKQIEGDLTKAQTDLKGLVTARQEGVLLEVGILE